jgi:isochorismate synthase
LIDACPDFTLGDNGRRTAITLILDSNRIETDLAPTAPEGRLDALLRTASERSRRLGRPVLASLSEPLPWTDPVTVFDNAAGLTRDRLLWSQPASGYFLIGAGAAEVIASGGPHRFSDTAAAWDRLCSSALIEAATGAAVSGPVIMGGFSFADSNPEGGAWQGYPGGRMVLPRVCLSGTPAGSCLTLNAVLRPGVSAEQEAAEIMRVRSALTAPAASPNGHTPLGKPSISELRPAADWRAEVAAATQAVRRGELRKVVLARAVRLDSGHPFDLVAAIRRLAAGYPTCITFAVAHGERCFLGATPERLLRAVNGEVQTTCLAGSYPRGTCSDSDRRLAAELLADAKERSEHDLVRSALADALGAFCDRLEMPQTPAVLKLANVQHLCTPISGRITAGRSLLRIVERLHPTPSVGGEPRAAALGFIREREQLDRGWYAGAVGWVDHRGDGEFAVAIRAALVHGSQATLFAGCGIVADSDPEREFAESCIKLTPMLTALGAA